MEIMHPEEKDAHPIVSFSLFAYLKYLKNTQKKYCVITSNQLVGGSNPSGGAGRVCGIQQDSHTLYGIEPHSQVRLN